MLNAVKATDEPKACVIARGACSHHIVSKRLAIPYHAGMMPHPFGLLLALLA
jgi:hypothetical protein